jgi:CRP-like cAMP-binding protein
MSNRLLLSLPQSTLKRIRPSLEHFNTKRGHVVARAGQTVEHIYFVSRGLISFIKTMQDGRVVEIGVAGIEGLTNPHAIFGVNKAALDAVVQIPGSALRIRRDTLRQCLVEDRKLREVLANYAYFAIIAFAQTAACNRLHHLEERCCRWLLIAHDSALSDTFQLTHEFLAMMLGVQRTGVSIAASALQRAGLITYRHGQVTITNRPGLEDAACECYGAMQVEFDKYFRAPKIR